MSIRKRPRVQKPIPVSRQDLGLWKIGVRRFDPRDPYHMAVSLSWPGFAVMLIGCWTAINVVFALLYLLGPGDIANARPGSFADAFFFSVETLATVGYGVMAPASLYGHIVSSAEIVTGMTFTAIFTGLLFVRFARPTPKFLYAPEAVVTTHNCAPTLMVRFANGRLSVLSNANVRLFALIGERSREGTYYRRVHNLNVVQSHLPFFVMPWTVMHPLDDQSPLAGYDAESLAASGARLFLTIQAHDQSLGAQVQDVKEYRAEHVRFAVHFADAVTLDELGQATADLSRIGAIEPDEGHSG